MNIQKFLNRSESRLDSNSPALRKPMPSISVKPSPATYRCVSVNPTMELMANKNVFPIPFDTSQPAPRSTTPITQTSHNRITSKPPINRQLPKKNSNFQTPILPVPVARSTQLQLILTKKNIPSRPSLPLAAPQQVTSNSHSIVEDLTDSGSQNSTSMVSQPKPSTILGNRQPRNNIATNGLAHFEQSISVKNYQLQSGCATRRVSNHQLINRLKKTNSSTHVQQQHSVTSEHSSMMHQPQPAQPICAFDNQESERKNSFRISKTQKFFSRDEFSLAYIDPQATVKSKNYFKIDQNSTDQSIQQPSASAQLTQQLLEPQESSRGEMTPSRKRHPISSASTNATELMSRQTFRIRPTRKGMVSRPSSILTTQSKENVIPFQQPISPAANISNESNQFNAFKKSNEDPISGIQKKRNLISSGESKINSSPLKQRIEGTSLMVPDNQQMVNKRQDAPLLVIGQNNLNIPSDTFQGREGLLSLRSIRELSLNSNPPSEIFFSSSNSVYNNVELRELLGQGAYGKVYKGFIKKTAQFVAVKQLQFIQSAKTNQEGSGKIIVSQQQKLQNYLKEIIFLKHLDHPHIVRYYDCRSEGDSIFVYMEQMTGGSISQMLQKYSRFDEALIRKFVKQIIEGLAYLHAQGIVHRDIKGANILSDGNGTVKLADFGAARYRDNFCPINSSDSEFCNSVKGSLYWMAPEALNQEPYGRKSDIWSLGCTMIEMATAKHPWPESKDVSNLILAVTTQQCPPIPDWLSPVCQDFIQKCCTFNKKERPSAKILIKHPFLSEED